jgi:hypothetical protein
MKKDASLLAGARAVLCAAALGLAAGAAHAASPPQGLALPAGARIGVVNLLDPEVTHFHRAHEVRDGFLKTYSVNWPLNTLLLGVLNEGLTQMGFAVLLVAPPDRSRLREECFLNAALARGLPKECAALLAKLAGTSHLDAVIALGPGLNDSAHATRARRRDLPEYLRGWCVVSGPDAAKAAPLLLNFTELLLIGAPANGVQLAAREPGGDPQSWTDYQPPADLRAIPAQQLDQLQPLFSAMLRQQADALLARLTVAR